jgi:hypothetical protein
VNNVFTRTNYDPTIPGRNDAYVGTYKSVKILVIVDKNTGEIITHYPVWPQ